MYDFEFSVIIESLPYILEGIGMTIFVSLISSFFAFLIGTIIAFLRNQQNRIVVFLTSAFVEFIRNTPLLIQLYIWYKGLPNLGVNIDPVMCGIIALSIYTGAFISEVLRAGINSIAKEQSEASYALGLSHMQTFRLIVFPQALRIVIPPLGSQFINLIKNSSLVSFIAVADIFYVVNKGASDEFRFFEFFLVGALLYMALTGIVAKIVNILENKYEMQGRMANF